ncbi:hypothetical protein FRC12_009128, partial [Ceratobasidium sp. 428]
MDSDKSVLRAFDPLTASGKENTSFNPAFATPTAKSSGPGRVNALTLSGFFNRYAHPRPQLQQSKLHDDILVDIGDREDKKRSVLASSLLGADFAEGIRRESFPGTHAHVPDISFNLDRVNEEGLINDRTHVNDAPHSDHPEGMSFVFENKQAPAAVAMHSLSTPVSQEPNQEPDQDIDMGYTIRMIPAPISPTRAERKEFPLASPARPSGVDASPVTAFKARTMPNWGPPTMRSASPTRIPSPTRVPSPVRRPAPTPIVTKPQMPVDQAQSGNFPKLKLDLGQGFEFALSEDHAAQPTPTRSGSVRPIDPQTLAGRAAAMQFISAEQTMLEADSIMDVQLPDVVEDEATTGFLWSKGGIHKSESMSTLSRKVSVSSRKREEPTLKPVIREPASAHKRQESAPVFDMKLATSLSPRPRCNSAASNLAAETSTTSTLPEDEPTLNISALGLSALGNTLLIDTSLEQLTAQVGALGLGNATFSGASFAAGYPSEDMGPKRQYSDFKTPKVTRTASNPLPEQEFSDMDVDVEATVKKPKAVKGRVVSDAVIDDLRSGRALHRAASSITSIDDIVGSQAHRRSLSKASSKPAESLMPRLRSGSAALQRTDSATSSHHSGSSMPHHQAESTRSHSQASSVAERDTEDETPHTRPSSTLSRPSSRLSSVYAASESSLKPPSYVERPGSAASFNDRPSSVASIRPPSVASTRTTSTRPESAASERPPSATSVTTTSTSAHRRMLSGVSVHPICTASENLRHLARGMEEDVRKEMQAFMLDDMEEYMRSEDDTCAPQPRAAPLTKTKSMPAAPSGIREPGTAPRVRPRTSMLPPPVPTAKTGSKVASAPRTGSRIIAPKSGTGSIAPKGVPAKSSSSTLGTRSS